MDCLTRIIDWFAEDFFMYIRILGTNGCMHILPLYVLDKLLCRDVSYQIVHTGITLELNLEEALAIISFVDWLIYTSKLSTC